MAKHKSTDKPATREVCCPWRQNLRGGICERCWKIRNNDASRASYAKVRAAVLAAYGNRCACCGTTHNAFLCIDHLDNDGTRHREEIGAFLGGGKVLYYWLRDNGFPEGFQLLCVNCNLGKRLGGCPHKGPIPPRVISPTRKRQILLREMALEAYGGVCACCGEEEKTFLQIDHPNGDGAEHRKTVPIGRIYSWLYQHDYPKIGFRLLCANCNFATRFRGSCPHKAEA